MDSLLFTRILCIVLWLTVAIFLAPSFTRFVKGNFVELDEWRAGFFFVAILLTVEYGWRIRSDDMSVIIALNAFTAALGVFILIVLYQGRAER